MRQRHGVPPASSEPPSSAETSSKPSVDKNIRTNVTMKQPRRSPAAWLIFFLVFMYSSWSVYDYQYGNLPSPLTAVEAGKRGFSEVEAMKHVKELTKLGPHPVGSTALDHALKVCTFS